MHIKQVNIPQRGAVIQEVIAKIGIERCAWILKELVILDDSTTLKKILSGISPGILDSMIIERSRGLNLLHLAIKHRSKSCIDLLMELGMDPNSRDNDGQSAASSADIFKNVDASLFFTNML